MRKMLALAHLEVWISKILFCNLFIYFIYVEQNFGQPQSLGNTGMPNMGGVGFPSARPGLNGPTMMHSGPPGQNSYPPPGPAGQTRFNQVPQTGQNAFGREPHGHFVPPKSDQLLHQGQFQQPGQFQPPGKAIFLVFYALFHV